MPELATSPIHLGLGATSTVQPTFTGDMEWYMGYADRAAGDAAEGRLVMSSSFSESWDSWEVHPHGSEVVLCTEGEITLTQEIDGEHVQTTIAKGEYVINPPGVWHTADVDAPATCLFITAGMGTEHRPR